MRAIRSPVNDKRVSLVGPDNDSGASQPTLPSMDAFIVKRFSQCTVYSRWNRPSSETHGCHWPSLGQHESRYQAPELLHCEPVTVNLFGPRSLVSPSTCNIQCFILVPVCGSTYNNEVTSLWRLLRIATRRKPNRALISHVPLVKSFSCASRINS
jgi:hypothetical protein